MDDLTAIQGIGPAYAEALEAGGIADLDDLRAVTDIDGAARRTGLPAPYLDRWRSMARLLRVEGVGPQFAEALVELGVEDLAGLSEADAAALRDGTRRLVEDGTIPEAATVEAVRTWQDRAARLVSGDREAATAVEVKLAGEVRTCRAMRHYYDPPGHPCEWFSNWGPFHTFDVPEGEVEPAEDSLVAAAYAGRRDPVPELLSGCRKAPIMSVGLNPNLKADDEPRRVHPYFDDVQQYARHFRFRTTFKYSIEERFYEARVDAGDSYGDRVDGDDTTLFEPGERLPLEKEYVSMYQEYVDILESFADAVGLSDAGLELGEDVSYYNFVACHSPGWDADSETEAGIVEECFHDRKHFLRQFVQSRPRVVVVFAKAVMARFVDYFADAFEGDPPDPGTTYRDLLARNDFRMRLDGDPVRVVFAPHPTGAAPWYVRLQGKRRIVDALAEEYERGNLRYDPELGHLVRPEGDCEFCDNDQFLIEPCRYEGHFETEDDRTVEERARDERRAAADLASGGDG